MKWYSNFDVSVDSDLYHFGILGMKWGQRRYQNKDGTYTALGKKRRKELTPQEKAMKKVRTRNRIVTATQLGFMAAYLGYTVHSINSSNTSQSSNTIIKKFGSIPKSTYEKTWADFAWEEVMK